jgi:hypothetical protein
VWGFFCFCSETCKLLRKRAVCKKLSKEEFQIMGTVFVVQTFPDERRLMTDLLEAANHDVRPFYTDAPALASFNKAIQSIQDPFAVVSSQRDMRRRDDIGNYVHDAVSKLNVPTLTIVYARAVGDKNFKDHLGKLKPSESHELVLVPKSSIDLSPMDKGSIDEREAVKAHIAGFFATVGLRVK